MVVDLTAVESLEGGFSCGPVDDEWGQIGELTICGPNTVEDVRFTASNLFEAKKGRGKKGGGSGTEVVLYLNVERDSSHTAFTLEFVGSMTPTDGGNGAKLLDTIAPNSPLADLYRIGPQLNKKGKPGLKISKTLIGRFSVPFRVTVTP